MTKRRGIDDGHFILKDRKLVAVSLQEWSAWFHEASQLDETGEKTRRHVAVTRTPLHRISTVFLGLDHRFSGDGPPICFETMVFSLDGEDSAFEGVCERYANWDDAELGHSIIVKHVERVEREANTAIAGMKAKGEANRMIEALAKKARKNADNG